jgi:hypothetical protein
LAICVTVTSSEFEQLKTTKNESRVSNRKRLNKGLMCNFMSGFYIKLHDTMLLI